FLTTGSRLTATGFGGGCTTTVSVLFTTGPLLLDLVSQSHRLVGWAVATSVRGTTTGGVLGLRVVATSVRGTTAGGVLGPSVFATSVWTATTGGALGRLVTVAGRTGWVSGPVAQDRRVAHGCPC